MIKVLLNKYCGQLATPFYSSQMHRITAVLKPLLMDQSWPPICLTLGWRIDWTWPNGMIEVVKYADENVDRFPLWFSTSVRSTIQYVKWVFIIGFDNSKNDHKTIVYFFRWCCGYMTKIAILIPWNSISIWCNSLVSALTCAWLLIEITETNVRLIFPQIRHTSGNWTSIQFN